MKAKKTRPTQVRWVRVTSGEDGNGGGWYCDIGSAYIRAESEVSARQFAAEANAEICRLISLRDKRRK